MADCVGVTKVTVGRFLRDSKQVFVALHGKIAATLDELGYIPDRASDALSNAASRAIGVLLPSLIDQVFVKVLCRTESVTDTRGYQTMPAHYGYKPEVEQERLESMLSWNIDGPILTERTHTPHTLKMIEVAGIPVVELMNSQLPCLDIAVGSGNFEAVRQMTTATIARGHHHIVYLDARLGKRTIIRQKGYEQAMLDAGLVPYSMMVERSSSYSSGVELICQVRREYSQLDGVFCTNGDLAVGAAFECQRLGLKIPDDTVIAGFHGHDIGQVMEPQPAGVLTSREQMGSIGAECLLARIRGGSVTPKMLDSGFTLSPDRSI